jgi:hypothetical protein
MSVAELLPSIRSLPRADKVELYRLLADELGHSDPLSIDAETIVLKPEDHCPYSPEELVRMRKEEGGRPLSEIWKSLGCA